MEEGKNSKTKVYIHKIPTNISYVVSKLNSANYKIQELLKSEEFIDYDFLSLEFTDNTFMEMEIIFVAKSTEFNSKNKEEAL